MKIKRLVALLAAATLTAGMVSGCGSEKKEKTTEAGTTATANNADGEDSTGSNASAQGEYSDDEIVDFTAFFAVPGSEINDGNEIQEIIAKKTGVRVKETWLAGQTESEAVGTIIAGGEYPDFINASDSMSALYDAGALIAWDDYIDKYPNIKNYYGEDWEKFRREDGHIYWMNPFWHILNEDSTTTHNDEAFWIQVRVLEWANYPKIETMDEYFDLLRDYAKANPTMEDGTQIIPYTILCEDWRYFCLENAPQFLDGYPNDGSVIVDPKTETVIDYNTTPTAKKYFQKLNEEYKAGIVDPQSFTQTYDEYIAKLSTGAVLGMIDQWWDFAFTVNDVFKQQGLDEKGCNYVPLGLTIEKGMENQWHTEGGTLNNLSGIAITVDCKDVDKAFQFIDTLLSEEMQVLRFWGVEGVDYNVDENGVFYRTEEMRNKASDTTYKADHMCTYSYFPSYSHGTLSDGKNAVIPGDQTSEFYESLAEPVKKCFEAYGVKTYPQLIGSTDKHGIWFPMYSYSNNMTTETPGGMAWQKMGETKHEWLPQVVMADDFEAKWTEYMDAYSKCKPEDFIAEMQEELERRIEAYSK